MARAKDPDVYVAVSSGTVRIDGKRRDYVRGMTVVRAGDPLLRAIPSRFRPLTDPVEARRIGVPERA